MALANARKVEGLDPADDIRTRIGDLPTMCGGLVLAATYVRPKTKQIRGPDGKAVEFHYADKTIDEDIWQGKVHLVLAMGPECYRNDERRSFARPYCEIGDWIVIVPTAGRMVNVNGVECRIINDVDVEMVISAPTVAY